MDMNLFPAVAEFLRGRTQLGTLKLVAFEEGVQRDALGFGESAWGVMPTLTCLKGLTITYPNDLAPGLAAWLIPYIGLSDLPLRTVSSIIEHGFPMVRVLRIGGSYWTVNNIKAPHASPRLDSSYTHHFMNTHYHPPLQPVGRELEPWPRRLDFRESTFDALRMLSKLGRELPHVTYLTLEPLFVSAQHEIPGAGVQMLPALIYVAMAVGKSTGVVLSNLKTLIQNAKHLRTIVIFVDYDLVSRITINSRVTKWKALDSRIVVLNSPEDAEPIEIWQERIESGKVNIDEWHWDEDSISYSSRYSDELDSDELLDDDLSSESDY
ncbi:hypothetical protein BDQ17DRAFT_1546784 [Cyathus striatus]|nr:hypothetical protein BDQ17DRAFT_1546784 [Cyathus striatus]